MTVLSEYAEATRLGSLSGRLLDTDLDAELQRFVEQGAAISGFPIALVTLVLRHTQFFRAYTGLPDELAVSRATDRCSSFCQFVVEQGRELNIENAANMPGLPQRLVGAYGIAAYFGLPVAVDGQVVGSLCVIHTLPATLSEDQKVALRALGAEVSQQLGVLARSASRTRGIMAAASAGAFEEMRNVMVPMASGAELGRRWLADLEGLVALSEAARQGELSADAITRSLAELSEARQAFERLKNFFGLLSNSADRGLAVMVALQELMRWGNAEAAKPGEVAGWATALAEHYIKLVGSVIWEANPDTDPVLARAREATAVLAVSLVHVAQHLLANDAGEDGKQRIPLRWEIKEHHLQMILEPPGGVPDRHFDGAGLLIDDIPDASIEATPSTLTIWWPLYRNG